MRTTPIFWRVFSFWSEGLSRVVPLVLRGSNRRCLRCRIAFLSFRLVLKLVWRSVANKPPGWAIPIRKILQVLVTEVIRVLSNSLNGPLYAPQPNASPGTRQHARKPHDGRAAHCGGSSGTSSSPRPRDLFSRNTCFDILIRLPDRKWSTSISLDSRNFKNDFSWNRHVWAIPSNSR